MLQALLPKKKKSKHADEGKLKKGSKAKEVSQATPVDVSKPDPPHAIPSHVEGEAASNSAPETLTPSWSQLVLDTTAEFLMVLDEQQGLLWSQPGKDEVANGFAQGVLRDAALEKSSILSSLLGPEQAKAALDTIATNKNWQGSLTVYCQPRLQPIAEGPGSGTCSSDSPPKPLASTSLETAAQRSGHIVPGVSPLGSGPPSNTEQPRKPHSMAQAEDEKYLQLPQPLLPQPPNASLLEHQPETQVLLHARDPSEKQQQQQQQEQIQEHCVAGHGNIEGDLLAPLPFPSNAVTKRGSCPGVIAKASANFSPQDSGLERQLSDTVQKGNQAGCADFGTRSSATGGKGNQHRESGGHAAASKAQAWSLTQAAMERLRSTSNSNNSYNRTLAMLESFMGASTNSASGLAQQQAKGHRESSRDHVVVGSPDGTNNADYSASTGQQMASSMPSQGAHKQSMRKSPSTSYLQCQEHMAAGCAKPAHLRVHWGHDMTCGSPNHGTGPPSVPSQISTGTSDGSASSGTRPPVRKHHSAHSIAHSMQHAASHTSGMEGKEGGADVQVSSAVTADFPAEQKAKDVPGSKLPDQNSDLDPPTQPSTPPTPARACAMDAQASYCCATSHTMPVPNTSLPSQCQSSSCTISDPSSCFASPCSSFPSSPTLSPRNSKHTQANPISPSTNPAHDTTRVTGKDMHSGGAIAGTCPRDFGHMLSQDASVNAAASTASVVSSAAASAPAKITAAASAAIFACLSPPLGSMGDKPNSLFSWAQSSPSQDTPLTSVFAASPEDALSPRPSYSLAAQNSAWKQSSATPSAGNPSAPPSSAGSAVEACTAAAASAAAAAAAAAVRAAADGGAADTEQVSLRAAAAAAAAIEEARVEKEVGDAPQITTAKSSTAAAAAAAAAAQAAAQAKDPITQATLQTATSALAAVAAAAEEEASKAASPAKAEVPAEVPSGVPGSPDRPWHTLSERQKQQQQQQQQQQQWQQQQLLVSYNGPSQNTVSCPMPLTRTHSEFGGLEALMEEEEEGCGEDVQGAELCYTCFEVNIKPVSLGNGRRAMVVSIMDNTEQIQIQAALSELAEAQLALLAGIMPHHALQFLALESTTAVPTNAASLAREHKGCTIMFMDIVGFTSMCKVVPPQQVLLFLNNLFSMCDRLTDKHGVHKVETAGDCYIVSGGIMSNHPTNGFLCTKEEVGEPEDPQLWARQVLDFSKDLLLEAKKVCMPHTGEPVSVRVGIHSGDVVSGLIGTKLPKFSLFGDTMNTSARMESTGSPNRIHVSAATYALLLACEDGGGWEPTGGVQVKGKGFMQTYFWVPPEGARLVSPATNSPITFSASTMDPTYEANAITTASPNNTEFLGESGFMALPAQFQVAGAITAAGTPHTAPESGPPRSPNPESTSERALPPRSMFAAGPLGIMGSASSGEVTGSSTTGTAGVSQKDSERSTGSFGSGSMANTSGLGSTYTLGAGSGRSAVHLGSRRARHLSLDPAFLGGARGAVGPGAGGFMVVGGQEEGLQPTSQPQTSATTPRGASQMLQGPSSVMGAPPGSYLSSAGSIMRCRTPCEAPVPRSLSSATARSYRSSRRCLSHRYTSYNGSMAAGLPHADTLTSPRVQQRAHGSLDQYLLRSRAISQSINSHPANDLQQVMDSFYDFNHRAVLDQGPHDLQHGGTHELSLGGNGGNGSDRHDPLRVILRALPVQSMGTTSFVQRTPSCSLQSPKGQTITPKPSVH